MESEQIDKFLKDYLRIIYAFKKSSNNEDINLKISGNVSNHIADVKNLINSFF